MLLFHPCCRGIDFKLILLSFQLGLLLWVTFKSYGAKIGDWDIRILGSIYYIWIKIEEITMWWHCIFLHWWIICTCIYSKLYHMGSHKKSQIILKLWIAVIWNVKFWLLKRGGRKRNWSFLCPFEQSISFFFFKDFWSYRFMLIYLSIMSFFAYAPLWNKFSKNWVGFWFG